MITEISGDGLACAINFLLFCMPFFHFEERTFLKEKQHILVEQEKLSQFVRVTFKHLVK